jgi:hypothetical protein
MALLDRIARTTPWTVLTVAGLALLAMVDYWRGLGTTTMPILRGSLPNLMAVPTLTFGFLMMIYPERQPYAPSIAAAQAAWFWRLWITMLVVVLAWEYLQLWGNLVFDWVDVYASLAGAALTVPVFEALKQRAFAEEQNDCAE